MSGTPGSRPPAWRLFSAIELPEAVLEEIARVQAELKAHLGARKWQPRPNMHVTVHFFGQVPVTTIESLNAILEAECRQFGPFELSLASAGTFPKRGKPRVLWLGLSGELERLSALENALRTALEPLALLDGEGRYTPHVTIARELVSPFAPDALETLVRVRPSSFWVKRLVLFRSQLTSEAPIYSPLESFSLGAKRR